MAKKTKTKKEAVKLGRKEVVEILADKTGESKKTCEAVLLALFETVTSELSEPGTEIAFKGFGKFTSKLREARTGRNPATGEELEIPESVKAAFKFAKGVIGA